MGKAHCFPPDTVHYKWDNSLEPALRIKPGDAVVYELREVSDGQITPSSTPEDLSKMDWDRVYPLAGPTYIEGAEPGDVLEVEVLDIHAKGWGWTAIIPGFGLLEEEFKEPCLKIWDLSLGDRAPFREGIIVPLDPFCGTMGVVPPEEGESTVMPPGRHGGNMDMRHLTKGCRLLLPVWVEGALFSLGDPHAAQGDGEVCVTGIEAPMYTSLRFKLRKGVRLQDPQLITQGSLTAKYDEEGYHVTMGIDPSLMEASKKALRHMIDHLSKNYGLSREDAYMLSSVVVDLKITEIVDKPNWIVSAYLPLKIFKK